MDFATVEQKHNLLLDYTDNRSYRAWFSDYLNAGPERQQARKDIMDSLVPRLTGAYLLYDRLGRPWYTGQTQEHFRIRLSRHNTRSDVTANRLFHPFELGSVELFYADKEQTRTVEAQIYHALLDKGTTLLNPEIPPRPAEIEDFPVPSSTITIGESRGAEYERNAFIYHTMELGDWIRLSRNQSEYHKAFGLRCDYIETMAPELSNPFKYSGPPIHPGKIGSRRLSRKMRISLPADEFFVY